LKSILDQTHLPDEIIVIDDGGLNDMPYRIDFEQNKIQCILKKKSQKGLTRSRNLGVNLATGDIVIFLDDDVVLTPNYIEKIVRVYESGFDVKLGGVGGVDLNFRKPGFLKYIEFLYNIIFLISPVSIGTHTFSGFSEQILTRRVNPINKIGRATILDGFSCSYHSDVFKEFLFAEDYPDNRCQGEDKDFSLRVSQKFNLYIQPNAQLYHYLSSIERPNKYKMGKNIILSAYRLFSRYVRKNKYEQIFFYYSFFGYFLKFFIRFLLTRKKDELERIKGFLDAFQVIRKNEII
jgi:glycosyltransferase involved in cell wall biosynthesis